MRSSGALAVRAAAPASPPAATILQWRAKRCQPASVRRRCDGCTHIRAATIARRAPPIRRLAVWCSGCGSAQGAAKLRTCSRRLHAARWSARPRRPSNVAVWWS
jgi:hypothetical protein